MELKKKFQEAISTKPNEEDFLVGQAPVYDVAMGIREFNP